LLPYISVEPPLLANRPGGTRPPSLYNKGCDPCLTGDESLPSRTLAARVGPA